MSRSFGGSENRWVNKELTDVLKQNTEHIRIGIRGNKDVTMTPAKQNNPSKFIPIMQVILCQQSCNQLQNQADFYVTHTTFIRCPEALEDPRRWVNKELTDALK